MWLNLNSEVGIADISKISLDSLLLRFSQRVRAFAQVLARRFINGCYVESQMKEDLRMEVSSSG